MPIWNGTSGNDSYTEASGTWTLNGAAGNDTIQGGWNDDSLSGGAGSDTLYGDAPTSGPYGNDTLAGDAGDDFLYGDAANDRYVYNFAGGGDDVIYDSAGSDALSISGVSSQSQLFFEHGDLAGYSYSDGLIALVSEVNGGTITNYIIIQDFFSAADTGGRIEYLSTSWGTLWLDDLI